MGAFEEFERHLQDALAHLYDPIYQPRELLWKAMGYREPPSIESLRAAIIQAIEQIRPAPDVPPLARARRLYELLSYRYVHELTQKETAQRLGITPRHLRREQQQAVRLLAQRLWERQQASLLYTSSLLEGNVAEHSRTHSDDLAWREQVRQELISLQQNAPNVIANVKAAMLSAVELSDTLSSGHSIVLHIDAAPTDLYTRTHPSALRQILITAIEKLAERMSSGKITLSAWNAGDQAMIAITGKPITTTRLPQSEFIEEMMTALGGRLEISRAGAAATFTFGLPVTEEKTVLVIDDNVDLVHFYRRYTEDTPYQIVHIREGQQALWAIEAYRPAIIVLDVMLPDIDGWDLLTQLRHHRQSQAIPIIVCSVVRRKELALSLGAKAYLPKPVRRQEFVHTLDQVLTGR